MKSKVGSNKAEGLLACAVVWDVTSVILDQVVPPSEEVIFLIWLYVPLALPSHKTVILFGFLKVAV